MVSQRQKSALYQKEAVERSEKVTSDRWWRRCGLCCRLHTFNNTITLLLLWSGRPCAVPVAPEPVPLPRRGGLQWKHRDGRHAEHRVGCGHSTQARYATQDTGQQEGLVQGEWWPLHPCHPFKMHRGCQIVILYCLLLHACCTHREQWGCRAFRHSTVGGVHHMWLGHLWGTSKK